MQYYVYWGERKTFTGTEKSPKSISYRDMRVADRSAYRLLKQGWNFVKMEYTIQNIGRNISTPFLFFIDEMGMFGKKKGVIKVNVRYCKDSSNPTVKEVHSHGHYILSDGSPLYFYNVKKSKNTNNEWMWT